MITTNESFIVTETYTYALSLLQDVRRNLLLLQEAQFYLNTNTDYETAVFYTKQYNNAQQLLDADATTLKSLNAVLFELATKQFVGGV